ncbi:ABC-type multidrug transport system, ATPase component [Methanocella conradii HZ254]|uniref:ABC-type multidrug transport system, ATPase component n=1 Tax=Methanocella conradii (strain DSM 24694 / JCM 17849 / CGMCC 1.5162 / HZ254) TaxID=1041930 RepID=H8I5U5_METCZ|nr:ABC transporter ATP-binding protein [Methanocella conradii]AFC99762.1 ABC-type multidrug transport system, ATPase component [Methanocella conradii HZ254]
MIEASGLTKMYDGVHGIRDVSLRVGEGESLGLLGPNGAGKTTLVRTLIGLLRPDSGDATINGISVVREPDSVRKLIGYLPEAFGLYEDMTVYGLLDYTGRLYRMESGARKERIVSLLRRFGLYDSRRMKAGTLSKGMRQKVGFARALLNDPMVVFLDEPTSGLDPIAARSVEGLIMELKKEGKTIIITSHILPEAEKMCDSVAIIKSGRVAVSGNIREVMGRFAEPVVMVRLKRPEDAGRAASFLSSMFPQGVEALDDLVMIRAAEPEKAAMDANRALLEANMPVLEVRVEGASLDEAYFKVLEG